MTVERRIKGIQGRRLWWETPVEESWATMEARRSVFQLGFLLEEDDYLYEEFESYMLIIAEYFLNFQKLINVTLKENLKCKSEHVTTLFNILLWLSTQPIIYI